MDKKFLKEKNKFRLFKYIPDIGYSSWRGVFATISFQKYSEIITDKNLDNILIEKIELNNIEEFTKDSIKILKLYEQINFLLNSYLFEYQNFDFKIKLHKIYEKKFENNEIPIEQILKYRIQRNTTFSKLLENEFKIQQLTQTLSVISFTNVTYYISEQKIKALKTFLKF